MNMEELHKAVMEFLDLLEWSDIIYTVDIVTIPEPMSGNKWLQISSLCGGQKEFDAAQIEQLELYFHHMRDIADKNIVTSYAIDKEKSTLFFTAFEW